MISGRGLGHSGGTLDKLESIPGFRIDLSVGEFKDSMREAVQTALDHGSEHGRMHRKSGFGLLVHVRAATGINSLFLHCTQRLNWQNKVNCVALIRRNVSNRVKRSQVHCSGSCINIVLIRIKKGGQAMTIEQIIVVIYLLGC